MYLVWFIQAPTSLDLPVVILHRWSNVSSGMIQCSEECWLRIESDSTDSDQVIKKRSRSFLHYWQLSVQIFIWYQLSIYLWVSIDLCSVWIILGHWYTGRYTCFCAIITFMLIKLNQEGLGIWNILIVVFKFGLQLFGDRIDEVRQFCILSVRTCCVWFWLYGGGCW